MIKFKIMGV